ncbi:MAG: site-specific integrase [Rhodomicrobium sp.]
MSAQTYNAENERIKRRYFAYLKEARRYSESSIDHVAKALNRFENYTRFREFRKFHIEQAIGFKRMLAEQRSERSGEALSKSTMYSTLAALKAFFAWLAREPGFRSRLNYSDAEYFSLSEKDTAIAKATREKAVPGLEQILHVLSEMPNGSEIERRNRALIAFTLLTGARDRAIASFKLRHVDLLGGKVFQDAREIKTKFSKTFTTWFFPVGEMPLAIVRDWIEYLTKNKLIGPADPLFPRTEIGHGPGLQFAAVGLSRAHWSTASPIRQIFKEAFGAAGLPYFNPHSFRDTLTLLAEKRCLTPEEFKAWSQNLGHEQVMTTFRSYGSVPQSRQAELIRKLGQPKVSNDDLLSKLQQIVAAASA